MFLVSGRALDGQILTPMGLPFTALPVGPMTMKPWQWPGFYSAWRKSVALVERLIAERGAAAVVATGGFVSGPAMVAAKRRGIPGALVNLDAVPGRANRHVAGSAAKVFSVYATPQLPGAQIIGMPLRRCVIGAEDKAAARREMGLDPAREVLLVTGASQGAQSLNHLMMELARQEVFRAALGGWQVLHLSGDKDVADLQRAYAAAKVPAKVLPFCDAMGLAWGSATLTLSRAGAGSVGEAWANAVPTLFFPYPYHRDQHQKFNALPLVEAGTGLLMQDLIDPAANAAQTGPVLLDLIANAGKREKMAAQLRATRPADGASAVAEWLETVIGK